MELGRRASVDDRQSTVFARSPTPGRRSLNARNSPFHSKAARNRRVLLSLRRTDRPQREAGGGVIEKTAQNRDRSVLRPALRLLWRVGVRSGRRGDGGRFFVGAGPEAGNHRGEREHEDNFVHNWFFNSLRLLVANCGLLSKGPSCNVFPAPTIVPRTGNGFICVSGTKLRLADPAMPEQQRSGHL